MLPTGERILASGSVQLPRFTLLESGSLLVSPTHISDAGTYTCLATNSRGVDEASADLVVWGEYVEGEPVTPVCVRVCQAHPIPPQHTHSRHQHLHIPMSVQPRGFLQEGLGQINSEERDQEGQGSVADAMQPRGLLPCLAKWSERRGDNGQLSSYTVGQKSASFFSNDQVVSI